MGTAETALHPAAGRNVTLSAMRAIRVTAFGGPDVLVLSQVDDLQPGPEQVRVRVHAAGVNPVETYIRTGTYARTPALPWTPGTDAGGVVDAVGAGVTRLAPGDRVFTIGTAGSCSGTYAEQAILDEGCVHRLPGALSFAQGAAVGVPCTTAWRAVVQKAQLQAAETVLVHGGSGAVGTAAIQLARALGATVLATAGSRALVERLGAHHVLDHADAGYRDAITRLTGGRGPDVIIEMLANVNLAHDLALIAPRGRIVIVGSRGPLEINPRALMGKDSTVTGMTLFNLTAGEWRQVAAGVAGALGSGALAPVVGRELPLADAAEAHALVMAPGATGKIALIV
jgi:NADPH:quinone reductase